MLVLGFGAVVVRLVDVQALNADRYAVLGQDQRLHAVVLPAQRGSIVDRNGAELAVSIPRSTVFADPQMVTDPAGAARALSPVLERPEAELRALLTGSGNFVYLSRRVEDSVAAEVEALALDGIGLQEEPTRVQPAGSIASSVLGEVGIDDEGLSGLERQLEDELAGTPGEKLVERDPSGRDIAGGVRQSVSPVRGDDVVLTLDRDLQFFTEQALARQITSTRSKGGIAVVMDPRTGEVLAIANVVAGAKGQSPRPAGYNKALIDVYEPGSVNKLITLAGALEEGAITPDQRFSVPDSITVSGTTFQDAESHPPGWWTPAEIVAHSSNSGAILVAQQLGKAGLNKYLKAFGMDDDTGLGFPGEAAGILPDLDDWSGTSLPTLAIGYGLAVTPLQMLTAYNTIANGGVHVEPTLVKARVDAHGKVHEGDEPERRRIVSTETARAVTAMLAEGVASGTGRTAAIEGYTVAGKTGTARKTADDGSLGYREGAYVASFAGFLPAESPRLSAIVVLDEPEPYTGALASGPVFAELAAYAARHFQVPPGTAGAERQSGGAQDGAQVPAATLIRSSATRP
ncbi:MAG: peptidoglycan D,D-transpeptidase FtsI family protein [Acidimicrobiia bacterium]